MVLELTSPRRYTPQPPQPVEPNDPIWVARFYQWLIDRINHLTECQDDVKDELKEQRVEVSAWMLAAKESDASILARVQSHVEEHNLIDQTQLARKSVWKMQGGILRDVLKFATEGTVIAALLGLMKYLGVL